MTLPLAPQPALNGQVVTATPATFQDALNNIQAGQTLHLQAGAYPRINIRGKRDILVVLKSGFSLIGSDIGIWWENPYACRMEADPDVVVTNSRGDGVLIDAGVFTLSKVRVVGNFAQGVLSRPYSSQNVLQIDRCELSDNGRAGSLSWLGPNYWKEGTHAAYLGGGTSGIGGKILFYDNWVHDQHSGYGVQFGGQVQNSVVAYNRWERIDGSAAPTIYYIANACNFFSSYAGSKNNVVVNNLFRNVKQAGVAANQNTLAALAHHNVGWQCGGGVVRTTFGGATSVTDGGNNVVQDKTTLQQCVDAGLFDPAYVPPWVMPTPPPGPTNRQLVEAAKAELEQTTVSGKNWVAGGRKPGHWADAYKLLDKVKD